MNPDRTERVLRWTCETCDWKCDVPMPGFAGGYWGGEHIHAQGENVCGPLVARMLPIEATPGTSPQAIAALVREAGL